MCMCGSHVIYPTVRSDSDFYLLEKHGVMNTSFLRNVFVVCAGVRPSVELPVSDDSVFLAGLYVLHVVMMSVITGILTKTEHGYQGHLTFLSVMTLRWDWSWSVT